MKSGYSAMIFIPNHEEESTENINLKLRSSLEGVRPDRIELDTTCRNGCNTYTGYWRGWSLTLTLVDQPYVAEESEEMAARQSFQPPFNIIRTCRKRIELWTDEDPSMDQFNTYLLVQERIEQEFVGALLTDGEHVL